VRAAPPDPAAAEAPNGILLQAAPGPVVGRFERDQAVLVADAPNRLVGIQAARNRPFASWVLNLAIFAPPFGEGKGRGAGTVASWVANLAMFPLPFGEG
jgi:hypothetical protein